MGASSSKGGVSGKGGSFSDEIYKVFVELDTDNSGSLDFAEVQEGLQKLRYPANYAFDVFTTLDKDNNSEIDFEEFKEWVGMKHEDMKVLFESVDRDNSGFIDFQELKLFLYHLDLPIKNASMLMRKLDKDGDQRLSFEEFRSGFALLHPSHFSSLKDTWMEYESDSDLAGVSAIDVSRSAKRDESKTVPAWTSAVAGGLGNSISRTIIAPLERTRVQMIADAGRYPSMLACMQDIFKVEGITGFWAGNALNIGRIAPQMAIAFYAKDYFKVVYAG